MAVCACVFVCMDSINFMAVSHLCCRTFQRSADPATCVLDAWCTDNAKVDDLINVLTEKELYRVADYLVLDVLKGTVDSPMFNRLIPPQ